MVTNKARDEERNDQKLRKTNQGSDCREKTTPGETFFCQ
jgi:hypothetical protein